MSQKTFEETVICHKCCEPITRCPCCQKMVCECKENKHTKGCIIKVKFDEERYNECQS